jgi:GT2 family glycosyltransferase
MLKVSIITVNFNNSHLTEELLDSVYSHAARCEVEWIVVDNGSHVDPVPLWRDKYKNIFFIRSNINLGFAGGNNLGIHEATGNYLFLVNNDTIFGEGLVDEMVAAMEANPQWGMACPLIRYFDHPGILQFAGYTHMNYFMARNQTKGQGQLDVGQFGRHPYETAFVHGAAMFVRKFALKNVGIMAENFFLYFEEYDWSEAFKRKSWGLAVVPSVHIFHKESMSVGKLSPLKAYFMTRNRILFIRKNAHFFQYCIFLLYFLLLVLPKDIFKAVKENNLGFIPQYFKAFYWNLTHPVDSVDTGYTP